MKKFGIAFIATAVMVGCGGSGESGEGSESTSGSEVAVSYDGAVMSTDVAGGQQIYADFCAGCHQDGNGGDGAAPAVNGIGWDAASMRRQVREGEGNMPAFAASTLADDQLESLLAYLVSTGGVTP